MKSPDVRRAAPADHRNRPQDTETATAKYAPGDHDRMAGTDSPAALAALVNFVIGGRDRTHSTGYTSPPATPVRWSRGAPTG